MSYDQPFKVTFEEFSGLRQEPEFDPALVRVDPKTVRLVDFLSVYNDQNGFTLPDVHRRIADWLDSTNDHPFRLLLAHREIGKSHLLGVFTAWNLFRDADYSTVIFSAAENLAIRNSDFIRKIFEQHPLTGHLVPNERQKSTLWQKTKWTVIRDRVQLNASVQVGSILGEVTGLHASHGISDDIETSENARTSEARQLVRDRVGEFSDIAAKWTFLGTPHHSDSIYKDMLSDPDFEKLTIPVYEEDHDGNRTYSWPERFNDREIERRRKNKTEPYFRSQYFLEFLDLSATSLPVEFIQAYPDEPKITAGDRPAVDLLGQTMVDAIAAWDPATGLPDADDSVLTIAYRDKRDHSYVHRCENLPPVDRMVGYDLQIKRTIELCRQFGVATLFVETNTNKGLPAQVRQEAIRAKVRLTVREEHSTGPKANRIASVLEPIIAGGRLHCHSSVMQSKLIDQVRSFPECVVRRRSKDDHIDSAALALGRLKRIPPSLTEGVRRTMVHQLVRGATSRLGTGGANARLSLRRAA